MSSPTEISDGDGDGAALAVLDSIEARILGCLIEKQATTPEAYPLTENAVVTACNQKTNRDPPMDLQAGAVGHALRALEARGLVQGSLGARATRYAHRLDAGYRVTPRQRAVLCVMLLRGPQTLSELAARSARLAEFPDAADLGDALQRLMQRSPPLVVRLARQPGQREDRYMHLLCGPVADHEATQHAGAAGGTPATRAELEQRVEALETAVAKLREELVLLAGAGQIPPDSQE